MQVFMGFVILYATMFITALALANRNHAVKAKHFFLLTCWSWRHWQDVSRNLIHFPQCVYVDTLNCTLYSSNWSVLSPFGMYRVFLFTCYHWHWNLSLSIASSFPFLFLCWVLLVWFCPDAFAPSPGDGPSEGLAPAAAADACAGSGGCSSVHKIHPAFYLCVPVYGYERLACMNACLNGNMKSNNRCGQQFIGVSESACNFVCIAWVIKTCFCRRYSKIKSICPWAAWAHTLCFTGTSENVFPCNAKIIFIQCFCLVLK